MFVLTSDSKRVLVDSSDTFAQNANEKVKQHRPLLVLVNGRSGGGEGAALIRQFRRVLNTIQVVDITKCPPATVLRRFSIFDTIRVLACGGDGTVAWVLGAVDEAKMTSKV